jgi:tRNA pseudouridine13 synthase
MIVTGLCRVNQRTLLHGVIKSAPEDFYVEELMDLELSGSGEHLYLFIEKVGQNTEFVAKQLARLFKVRSMDVGFSGLKDRWAVTRQWFSIYVRNQTFENLTLDEIEGVRLISSTRHSRKLRRGEHRGNAFRICVRGLSAEVIEQAEGLDAIHQALDELKERGFPNYFGVQRFGRDAQNLERARQWFRGEIKASRSQRSFYLSAVRSYLFNTMLSEKVEQGDWLEGEGPLYGDPVDGLAPLNAAENAFFERFPELVAGLHKNRMTLARRPYRMRAENLEWEINGDSLTLSFALGTGAFATSLLAEFIEVEDGSVRDKSDT